MVKALALTLAATALVCWTTNAEARGRCCPTNCCAATNGCAAVAASNVPAPDAVASAPATTGVRSMSVQPSTAPVRYYTRARYTRTPSYLLPKTDIRKFD